MAKTRTYNLYSRDGQYLGQHQAFAPEAAFLEYLTLQGEQAADAELRCQPMGEDLSRITFDGSEYLLMASPAEG